MNNQETEKALAKDADARSVLLSGLGFYKLSVRRRKQLAYVFGVSLVIHVVGLIGFGGWTIWRDRTEKVAIFNPSPPARTYEPRKLEHRVKLTKRQRSSSRPSMVPRLVSMKLTDLALPEIKVDPKLIHTSFQPKFKAVSGKGLGAGLGTGYGTDGFGDGVSSYDFFGIHAGGEKIAILVDVSVSMVEEERGGEEGYNRVKQRLNQTVDALSEGTLFNVILFADACRAMQDEMMIASKDNKTRAKLFLRPYNTEGNWGLTDGNAGQTRDGLGAYGGTTRLDLALNTAYMEGADTILIISDGIPRVQKQWSADQMQGFRQQQSQWQQEHAREVQAYDDSVATGGATATERVWVPPTPARPASKKPPKEGQAPDMGSPARPGYWHTVTTQTRAHGSRPTPPPIPDPGFWTLADFIEHLNILYGIHYEKQGKKPPIVHGIGYMIDKDGHAFLQGLARHFKGQYRRVARLK